MRNPGERGTRERILEVAESSLGDRGYHGTRLHEIARKVGIQKASLFHYFPSKDELYRAVIEEGFGETEQTIRLILEAEATPLQKVRSIAAAYVDLVAAHPDRTKILLRQSLGDAPADYHTPTAERLVRSVAAVVNQAQERSSLPLVDPMALVLAVVGLVAFFFTSVPVLAPVWLGDSAAPAMVERVKRVVLDLVDRCLASSEQSAFSGTEAAAAAPTTISRG